MDFFEHQELARKSTENLLFLFALAVAAIVGTVYLAIVLAWQMWGPRSYGPLILWEPRLFGWTAAGVLAVIALGSLWKSHQLRGGGAVVAQRLGGRRIDLGTTDPHERRVLNVVQEMAIASGTPVPEVYLLEDESGINAFAAGHGEGDAVIGVTRGAIQKLSRDELQGVMGHEFSHLLNGDMRLNLRLMGVVHGILLIALVGRGLMHPGRTSRRRKDGGAQVALVGLALLLIGYVGVFFANLIKAAVSRQREFLADASAVQFTRNPAGIAGALEKIGGFATGSRMVTARADEASHMFFGDGKVHRITAAMATHPPLTERIRRIDPSFEGRFSVLAESYVAPTEEELTAPAAALASPGYARGPASALAGAAGLAEAPGARAAADVVAAPPRRPPRARAPARPDRTAGTRAPGAGARALGLGARTRPRGGAHAGGRDCARVRPPDGAPRSRARAPAGGVVREDDLDAAPAVDTLLDACGQLEPDARLPVLEVAAAALGTLPPERFAAFSRTVRDLVEGDRRVELSEWLLARLLLRQVSARLEPAKPAKPRYRSVRAFAGEAAVLLSALAHAGHDDPSSTERAFEAAARELRLPGARLCGPEACAPRALEAALETFALLFPEEKRRLLSACAASVAADWRVLPREAELFRMVSDWLGVPVPPLLPGQLLA